MLQDLFIRFYLFIFSISVLLFGNIFRFLSVGGINNNILITELFLYILTLFYMVINLKSAMYLINIIKIPILIFFFSFLIGFFQFEFDIVAFSYFLRFQLFMLVSIIIGFNLYKLYEYKYLLVFKSFLLYYTFGLFIGYIIYIFFNNSQELWAFLSLFGIEFSGDPHVNRFVSVYFDPNFYAVIAILPILMSYILYVDTRKNIYLILSIFFILSLILAGSRSGTATFVGVVFFIIFPEFFCFFKRMKIKNKTLISLIIFSILLFILSPLYIDNLLNLWDRLLSTGTDDSGNARYLSFLFALDIIEKYPYFGLGYNYLSSYMLSKGMLSSVDSSVMSVICTLGFTLAIVIFIIIYIFLYDIYIKIKKIDIENLKYFIRIFYFYLIITIFFASNFNNILFYFFWFIPNLGLIWYFYFYTKNMFKRRQN